MLIRSAGIAPGQAVLDIGCGAGTSTRAAARAAAPGGSALGVDIAPHMVEAATAEGGAGTSYAVADAQDHPFPPHAFDRVISQFGTMFFADTVAAFANLRAATRPGGRCAFAAWAAAGDNPWFRLARAAAAAELGDATDDPDAPGPTRFRDCPAAAALLTRAGWSDARAEGVPLDLHPAGGLAGAAELATRVGPAARLIRLKAADEAARARIVTRLREAFSAFDGPEGLRIPALVNLLTATAP